MKFLATSLVYTDVSRCFLKQQLNCSFVTDQAEMESWMSKFYFEGSWRTRICGAVFVHTKILELASSCFGFGEVFRQLFVCANNKYIKNSV